MDASVVKASLDDWQTAPISERLRLALGFLQKLNNTPDDVTTDDVIRLQEVGIDKQGIAEIAYVCFIYNILDRLADAFGFEVGSDTHVSRASTYLNTFGYSLASLPG